MLPVDIKQCDLLKKKRFDYAHYFLQGQVAFQLYLTGYIAKAQRPAEDISWFVMSKGLGGHLMFQAFSYHQEPFSLNLDLTLDVFFFFFDGTASNKKEIFQSCRQAWNGGYRPP